MLDAWIILGLRHGGNDMRICVECQADTGRASPVRTLVDRPFVVTTLLCHAGLPGRNENARRSASVIEDKQRAPKGLSAAAKCDRIDTRENRYGITNCVA